jgi:hypothetical protein
MLSYIKVEVDIMLTGWLKAFDGTYDVEMFMKRKIYTFTIPTENIMRQLIRLDRAGLDGKLMALLKRENIAIKQGGA